MIACRRLTHRFAHAMFGALVAPGRSSRRKKAFARSCFGRGTSLLRRPGHAKFRRDGQRDAPCQLGEDYRIEHGHGADARRSRPGSAGVARDTRPGDRGRARRGLWRRIPAQPRCRDACVAPDARLSVIEMKWGLVPNMGGIVLLRRLVRGDVARELIFSGRIFNGPGKP